MTRIFNVSYSTHHRPIGSSRKTSIILIDIHPLIWAVNPPDNYNEYFFITIESWTEVDPKDVTLVLEALENQEILAVQDYRSKDNES